MIFHFQWNTSIVHSHSRSSEKCNLNCGNCSDESRISLVIINTVKAVVSLDVSIFILKEGMRTMKHIKEMLENKEIYLREMIQKAELQLKSAPDGRLIIKNTLRNSRESGAYSEFYVCTKDNQSSALKTKYVSKANSSLISSLAQKDYNLRLLRKASEQLRQTRILLNHLKETSDLSDIYANLSPVRKQLIDPLIPDNDEYVHRWKEVSFKPGYFDANAVSFETMNGELVRSKSEKILADTFYTFGIPYRYEYELVLNNGTIRRPDFMLLNVNTKKEYYWEHAGMMDNPEYAEAFSRKMNLYTENGIFPGVNLILTFESSRCPLKTQVVERLIRRFLL